MEIISQETLTDVAYHLLINAATRYPTNYFEKLLHCLEREKILRARRVLTSIIENIISATEESLPLCQDTGIPTFHVYLNPGVSIKGDLKAAFHEAVVRATSEVPLRKNVLEPFSLCNSGDNTGWGAPFLYFHYDSIPGPLRIRAEMKGFGGEIKTTADWIFTSTRNMEDAVLAYVLNNVVLSRGESCMPGFLGIGVGGYASEAAFNAKNAVFRGLSEKTPGTVDDSLLSIEDRILRCVNSLGIGPMGGGGTTTTMDVYLERRGAHTASTPVAVSHQCWASRGSEALVSGSGQEYITPHLRKEDTAVLREKFSNEEAKCKTDRNVHFLNTPIRIDDIRKLRVLDVVYLNGVICTLRDRAHSRMVELVRDGKLGEIPQELLENGVIYHSGPIAVAGSGGFRVFAAGPTTSSRFSDDAGFLVDHGIMKVVIGKGTMDANVKNSLKNKGVFMTAVGGCSAKYQKMISQTDVKWLDLGYPEALWIFKVENFGPLIVEIDSLGNSLNESVVEHVYENAREIYRQEGLDPHKRYIQYPQTFAGLSLEEIIEREKTG